MAPDTSSPLLLTRPVAQSQRFLAEVVDQLGYVPPHEISPILEIRQVSADPAGEWDQAIFTSQNALRCLPKVENPNGRVAWCVGDRTAKLAAEMGFEARSAKGSASDLLELIQKSAPTGRLMHFRGHHSRGDLANRLRSAGFNADERVIYDQAELPLSEKALHLLQTGPAIVPIFSPRSAGLIRKRAPKMATTVRLIALSPAVAALWYGSDHPIQAVHSPTSSAMVERVVAELTNDSAC